MEFLNLVLSVFGGAILILNAFASRLQRSSLPAPLLALLFGLLIGPYGLHLISLDDFGGHSKTILEEAARITLGIGLVAVALRLPHGYWRSNWRWWVTMIGLGMLIMWSVAAGLLYGLLGLPLLIALLIAAIITPTDPISTTPIVTGPAAEENIPDKVRHNISSESGLNDGLAYLFVFLPLLLLTKSSEHAWKEWFIHVLLWEVMAAIVLAAIAGYALAKLFVFAKNRNYMDKTSYFGFMAPMALLLLGGFKLIGTDAVLAVFVAATVFGQTIPARDESQEDVIEDTVTRFFIIPVFILLGLALPVHEWGSLGIGALMVTVLALLLRRMVAVWALWPLYKTLHSKTETMFLSWFGAIGVSALYYALLAERKSGNSEIFLYVSFAIAASLLLHGVSTMPFGKWLKSNNRK